MNRLFSLLFVIIFSCTPLYGQVIKINGGLSTMIILQNSQGVEGMLTDEPRIVILCMECVQKLCKLNNESI